MTLNEFYNKYKGQANVGNTEANRGECVGISSLWMDNFNVPHVYGHAKDLYANAPDEYFAKISNTPDAIIQDGDIAIWSAGYNGTYGHTGVAFGKHDVNNFDCFEQNDPLGSTPHIKRYNYAYVIGWLRPKGQIQPSIDYEKLFNETRVRRDALYNLSQAICDLLGVRNDENTATVLERVGKAIHDLQNKPLQEDTELQAKYQKALNDIEELDIQLVDVGKLLKECEKKPPKEKLVTIILYAKDIMKMSFLQKIKLLFS